MCGDRPARVPELARARETIVSFRRCKDDLRLAREANDDPSPRGPARAFTRSTSAPTGQKWAGGSGGSSRPEARRDRWRIVEGTLKYEPLGAGIRALRNPRLADMRAVHEGTGPGSPSPLQGAYPTHGPVHRPKDRLAGAESCSPTGVGGESSDLQQQRALRKEDLHLQ